MGRVLEFTSMLILGMLLILAMTHFLNGTLISWVESKFSTKPVAPSTQQGTPAPMVVSGSNASGANNA